MIYVLFYVQVWCRQQKLDRFIQTCEFDQSIYFMLRTVHATNFRIDGACVHVLLWECSKDFEAFRKHSKPGRVYVLLIYIELLIAGLSGPNGMYTWRGCQLFTTAAKLTVSNFVVYDYIICAHNILATHKSIYTHFIGCNQDLDVAENIMVFTCFNMSQGHPSISLDYTHLMGLLPDILHVIAHFWQSARRRVVFMTVMFNWLRFD